MPTMILLLIYFSFIFLLISCSEKNDDISTVLKLKVINSIPAAGDDLTYFGYDVQSIYNRTGSLNFAIVKTHGSDKPGFEGLKISQSRWYYDGAPTPD